MSTPFPIWTPQTRTTGSGRFTREQWALVDSETANARQARVDDMRAAVAAAEQDGRPTVGMLRRSLTRAVHVAGRSVTHCTNSGMLRTQCDTCDHTRQLLELAAVQGAEEAQEATCTA